MRRVPRNPMIAKDNGPREPTQGRVLQVLDALDYGDAVAGIACRNADLLREVGGEGDIVSLYAHERMAHLQTRFESARLGQDDGLIVHYSCFSELEEFLGAFRGRKVLYYHNITPPTYFSPGTQDFQITTKGYAQLARIAGEFELVVGDSQFNLDEYARFLDSPLPTLCIYPTVERETIRGRPFAAKLLDRLRRADVVNLLFVGRIARNKRQDRVMQVFDEYWRRVNRHSRLLLVGAYEHSPDYLEELEALRTRLPSGDQIVLTGKVADEELQAYYRAAHVYVSASEHEGFGLPLLEAMAHGLPVVAFAAAAVPETMGRAGILVREWDVPRLAELVHLLVINETLRERIREGQVRNLSRFSRSDARMRLRAVVDFLRTGVVAPLMTWRGPGNAAGARQ